MVRPELGVVEKVEAISCKEKGQNLVHKRGERRASAVVDTSDQDAESRFVHIMQLHLTLGLFPPLMRPAKKCPKGLTATGRMG